MVKKDAIWALISHFNATSWPQHLNEQKLLERAEVVTESGAENCQIVEIERHRPLFGLQYVKGAPMAAYETYFMRYSVPDGEGQVTELPERSESGLSSCDPAAIAEEYTSSEQLALSITRRGAMFEIRDDVSKERRTVRYIEEAQEFGQEIAGGISDYFADMFCMTDDGAVDERQRERMISAVSVAIHGRVAKLVEEIWNRLPG